MSANADENGTSASSSASDSPPPLFTAVDESVLLDGAGAGTGAPLSPAIGVVPGVGRTAVFPDLSHDHDRDHDHGKGKAVDQSTPGAPETGRAQEDGPVWGESFKVEWVRTERLPFTRTRHLRNPWNHDREVKVSRDGTELEPSVGQALLDEWDRPDPPPPSPATERRIARGAAAGSKSPDGEAG